MFLLTGYDHLRQARIHVGGWRKFPLPNPKFSRKNFKFWKRNVWYKATILFSFKNPVFWYP